MAETWDEAEAARFVERWGAEFGTDLAIRAYTARLLGADPALVLHGGGNTSVKTTLRDDLGRPVRALCVKGSGWDLATIEPAGHVALDLDRLLPLRDLDRLDDAAMVNAHRTRLLDASAPNPSVEALLHAFLPHPWIDHSHAEAVLAVSDREDGWERLADALGPDVIRVPYVMPGFALAKAAAQAFEAQPDAIGMVLHQHGLFTFGATAQESYARHLAIVARAERWLDLHAPDRPAPTGDLAGARARAIPVLQRVRGLLARRWIADLRVDDVLLDALSRGDLDHLAGSGPLTPDHVLRTRCWPWRVDLSASDLGLGAWRARNRAYVETCGAGRTFVRLDEDPRALWVPGVGVIGLGATAKDAAIAADISERTLRVKRRAAAAGPFRGLPDTDLFDMEHWSLEQAKLGKATEPALARRVAWITGGAGAIGVGVAAELIAAGAHVALVDRDPARLAEAVAHLGGRAFAVQADVTSEADVQAAIDATILRFGGIDLVVLGAGIAVSASLDATSVEDFDRVVAVNLGGTQRCLRAAARALRAQGRGGDVVLISSKNVMGPGANFSAYSASKAGAHQLCKVAALELAEHDIRVNLVAPDAVFAEGPVRSGLWDEVGPARAAARGLAADDLPEHYRQRNLLKSRVTGRDVGQAVLFFARRATPTTGATLPVDGGLPDAFPR